MEGWLLACAIRYLPLMENRMKSILDPTFHYVPSVDTDLKKTFARIRREMNKAQMQKQTMTRVVAATAGVRANWSRSRASR